MSEEQTNQGEENSLIEFHCEKCSKKISVPKIHAGKKGRCPNCKTAIIVPVSEKVWAVGLDLDPDVFDIPLKLKEQKESTQTLAEDVQKLKEKLGIPEKEPPPERKYPFFLDIFLYPANAPGLTILGIIIGIPILADILLWFLKLATIQFGPIFVFYVFFKIIAFIIKVIIFLYIYWYYSECVRDSAEGGLRAPETMSSTPGLAEILGRLIRIVACFIIIWIPVLYYIIQPTLPYLRGNVLILIWDLLAACVTAILSIGDVYPQLMREEPVFSLLTMLSMFFFPIALLSVIMFDSLRGLNPILLIRAILKTFLPYCGLAILFAVFGILAVGAIKSLKFWNVVLFSTVLYTVFKLCAIYLFFIIAHIQGRFYWRYQKKLNWEV